jgi:3-deoxy-D-manno-octulosonic-acid transferase
MISPADAGRIVSLGAEKGRIRINGNAKFDSPDPMADGGQAAQWARALFGIADRQPVFIAGSTRHDEERTVLDAHARILKTHPDALLIIAPRHINRVPEIEAWVAAGGFTCRRRTELSQTGGKPGAQVVLLDTIGELAAAYSIASFVFCGGSLVPKGGQNLLEPAMWAKPIMHGPSMEDFADAQQLIEKAGGGRTVHDAAEMAALAHAWLADPAMAAATGARARQAIRSHRGAAARHAAVIADLLGAR